MAKKRKIKDQEAEEAGFQFPEFDRAEYERKEVRDGKLTIATIFYAAVFAMFSFVVALYGDDGTRLGVFIGFGGMFTLRHFLRLAGFNMEDIEIKHIVGYSMLFLFTWLAIWTVISNPPASDISRPSIETIEVREYVNGSWVRSDYPVDGGETRRVYARVYDYGDLDTVTLEIWEGDTSVVTSEMTEFGDGWYYYEYTFNSGDSYTLKVSAVDTAENSSTRSVIINAA